MTQDLVTYKKFLIKARNGQTEITEREWEGHSSRSYGTGKYESWTVYDIYPVKGGNCVTSTKSLILAKNFINKKLTDKSIKRLKLLRKKFKGLRDEMDGIKKTIGTIKGNYSLLNLQRRAETLKNSIGNKLKPSVLREIRTLENKVHAGYVKERRQLALLEKRSAVLTKKMIPIRDEIWNYGNLARESMGVT